MFINYQNKHINTELWRSLSESCNKLNKQYEYINIYYK
jgi:hypothetical protein